ncbi:MAG TPA: hypothetical protein VFI04_07135 [Gaiellaceae bacterium]|nr:hypothetical protein [Gaiellaceae bacterium]
MAERTEHTEELIAERAARNQSLFRDANERIQAATPDPRSAEPLPFVCECPETRCTAIIRLEMQEYELVRADAAHFCVAPGHEVCEIDGVRVARVIERREMFSLMEKVGIAGDIARQLAAPRGPHDG